MIPLFKSTYSLKSILTLEKPGDSTVDGPDSIFDLVKQYNLDRLVLVEDTMIGFKKALETSQKLNLPLVFGVRFQICNDRSAEDKKSSAHKIIIFAKNDDGARELMKLYSAAFSESEGFLDYKVLAERWSANLDLAIPFYDSFIHRNNFYLQECVPDLSFARPTVFLESNLLPFDENLRAKAKYFAAQYEYPTQEVKTIYYSKREDIAAFCTYKIITNRQGGKAQTLEKPELEDFCSSEFSFESFLENQNNE